jgi:hypothetical protein
MSRKLKVIGLAAIAVLAVTAMSASAAQAAPKFTSTSSSTFLKGEQKTANVFTTNGGKVECSGALFETPTAQKGTELASVTVHPTYTGCKAFGLSATIETTGCNYVLAAAGTATIECESGKSIKISIPAGACSITVGAQGPLSSVSYTNEGSGTTASVLVTANVSGITYTSTGGACGTSGTNGTYTGTVLTKGFTATGGGGSQVGLAWDAS